MVYIWISFFVELLILACLKNFITNYESFAILSVLIHAFFVMIILMSSKSKYKYKYILLSGFITRLFLLFWDLYGRKIWILPGSGLDTEMFYDQAIMVSNNLDLLSQDIRGELFGKINGIIFYFIGPQRLVGQYLNLLLGISTLYVIYKIIVLLNINHVTGKRVLIIAAFFPNSMIMSVVFLREAFPSFFVTASIYFFVKWFKKSGFKNIAYAFLLISIASIFHSGVIGVIVGYVFALLFFQRQKNNYEFTFRTVLVFAVLLILMIISIKGFGNLIFGKFGGLENIENIYSTSNYREGGSVYLEGLIINNPIQLLIYGPIKMIYFMISPLPMDWRGFTDIFAFLTDSILYLYTILYLIRYKHIFKEQRALIICFIIIIIASTFIFGAGVSNAGTAMRHRQKLVSIFLILLALMKEEKMRFNKNNMSVSSKSSIQTSN